MRLWVAGRVNIKCMIFWNLAPCNFVDRFCRHILETHALSVYQSIFRDIQEKNDLIPTGCNGKRVCNVPPRNVLMCSVLELEGTAFLALQSNNRLDC
jgi:hypothetical protein